ncbi:hypothetical protein CLU79DRAFT_59466 [Phycomyces nitens]|nr:hypothetical protein CLU79DRAFT_59466 [Phycomyces nitens]
MSSDSPLNAPSASPQLDNSSSNDPEDFMEPSEINKHTTTATRKRTRASAEQLAVLEDTFAVNVSPNSKLRKQLAERLQMSERSIQIWFQNRRAKVKHMQKRAQMQMQQASIRAQLYHYQQQQYSAHPYASLMPQQPIHQYPLQTHHHQQLQHNRILSRAQSVDAIQPFTPYGPQWQPYGISRQSMPPHAQDILIDLPDYLHGPPSPSPSPHRDFHAAAPVQYPLDPTLLPTLVPVPDAGPTAMLATQDFRSKGPSTPANTPPTDPSLWPGNDLTRRSQVPPPSQLLTTTYPRPPNDLAIHTVDPSSLSIPSSNPHTSQSHKESYFNASTLIIGTWHRLKLRATDLLCVYRPDQNHFSWHITDSSCHFKMVVPIASVSSISHVSMDSSQAIHFDMSEPPLFYMESNQDGASVWIQCSDFTEGKQASRFFRHTLKGMGHTLKEDLMVMMNRYEKLRRLVRFLHQGQIMPEPMLMSHTNYMVPQEQQAVPYWDASSQPLASNMFMNQSPVGGFFG